jgi:hypothetical protein
MVMSLRVVRSVESVRPCLLTSIAVLVIAACAHDGARGSAAYHPESHEPNQVVECLAGAERQAETDEQRQEILRALEDLGTLDPATLKQRRYADYDNTPGQWTLVQVLRKYFVPQKPCAIDEAIYLDAQSKAARDVLEQQMRALREGGQVLPPP